MKPVRVLTAATLFVTAVTGAFAQEAAREMPGTGEVSRISGGTYTVDPDHTQIVWTVDHMGITPLAGMFGASAGTLVLDPSKPDDAKLEVTIPMAGLRVTSEEFATHLASPDILDTAKFPTATFKSSKITVEGSDATIEGELTLHGVTKPVTMDVSFFGAGINPMTKVENIGFTGTTEIKRSDFGLGYGVPAISDEVALDIVAAFIKQP